MAYEHQNYVQHQLTLEGLSRRLGVSRAALEALVKEEIGHD